jgi:hypothetical protein
MLEPVFTPEQIAMLNTPLNPSEIEQKQGMSYLKGQLAVVKANNIFGYGNWGYQLASGVEVIDTETKNRNDNVIYRVRVAVTLTVRGCMPITELGDCEAQGTGPAAMSMAEKGAVTDGLKRCLKNFGPCFGLDLYFKTPPAQTSSQPTAQQPRQQPTTQAIRAATTQNQFAPGKSTSPSPNQPQAPAPRPATQNGNSAHNPPIGVATLAKPSITVIGPSKATCPKCAAPLELLKVVEETGETFQGERCIAKGCGYKRKVATV